MVNYRECKIVEKKYIENKCIMFLVDEILFYEGGRYGTFISVSDSIPFNTWQVGDYLEIDLDRIWRRDMYSVCGNLETVRKVDSLAVVPRNNNNLVSISQSQASGAIQMLNRAIDSDPRNKYTASMEVDPKTGNVFYHLSGERK